MFNKVLVDYYGAPTPVPQMSSITVPEARMAVIKPYDTGQLSAIEKAIRDSDLGVNPTNDGQISRVVFPPLTEERRRDLAKLAGKYAEQQRISVRNVRRDANEELKRAEKDGAISQDEEKKLHAEVQKFTDEAIKRIDDALHAKEQEIMQV
jgi:ribosome recycling factor